MRGLRHSAQDTLERLQSNPKAPSSYERTKTLTASTQAHFPALDPKAPSSYERTKTLLRWLRLFDLLNPKAPSSYERTKTQKERDQR